MKKLQEFTLRYFLNDLVILAGNDAIRYLRSTANQANVSIWGQWFNRFPKMLAVVEMQIRVLHLVLCVTLVEIAVNRRDVDSQL